jgi:hypothetical protein
MSDQMGWSGSAILWRKPARGFAHFIGQRVVDIDAIDDAHDSSLDRHVLISDRRSRCFAERAHHHLAGAGSEPVCNDDDISRRLFIEIIRMHDQKPDAFEIGRLLGGPNCADDSC